MLPTSSKFLLLLLIGMLLILPLMGGLQRQSPPVAPQPHRLISSLSLNSTNKVRVVEDSIRFHKDFCKWPAQYLEPAEEAKARQTHVRSMGIQFDMVVHATGDIVSDLLLRTGTWEDEETMKLLNAVESYMHKRGISDRKSVTILDIGAEVGWYTMSFASKGFRVVAFEPMHANWYMLSKSMCINQSHDIILINAALGPAETECTLYAEEINKGNAHLYCGGQRPPSPSYVRLATVSVLKLDDFADFMGNLVAIKMDIEGSEHNAVKGGRKVFLDRHVPFILTEYGPHMIREKGGDPIAYLTELQDAGYRFSMDNFGTPYVSIDQILAERTRGNNFNLFLTHSSVDLY